MRRSFWLPAFLSGFAFIVAVFMAGCGGNAVSPVTTTTPNVPLPATPTPNAPTPPPSTGSGSTGQGSGALSVQFQVSLDVPGVNGEPPAPLGMVTVNNAGDTTVQVSGGTKNATLRLELCQPGDPCFDIGMLSTDGSGNAQTTFHFPKSGTFAGTFFGQTADKTVTFSSHASNLSGTGTFTLQLESEWCKTRSMGCATEPQDPLHSGTVTMTNGNDHVVITGAAANATYSMTKCGIGISSCYDWGTFTTDASGDAAFDRGVGGPPGTVLLIFREGAHGFVTGFKVP